MVLFKVVAAVTLIR